MAHYLSFLIFPVLSVVYYVQPFGHIAHYEILLTISTFLFSIFTGFFIARQGNRYSAIRDRVTSFDGTLSGIYRLCGHLGTDVQAKSKQIITAHYETILSNHAWDYHVTHKSETITSLHTLIEEKLGGEQLPTVAAFSVQRILYALKDLQSIRKSMIALYYERVPRFQWMLMYFLGTILFLTLSIIPSQELVYSSILKGAFASSIIFVFILLRKFDELKFFEKKVGEDSARDVLDIFAERK